MELQLEIQKDSHGMVECVFNVKQSNGKRIYGLRGACSNAPVESLGNCAVLLFGSTEPNEYKHSKT
jgi:hypothetical protein